MLRDGARESGFGNHGSTVFGTGRFPPKNISCRGGAHDVLLVHHTQPQTTPPTPLQPMALDATPPHPIPFCRVAFRQPGDSACLVLVLMHMLLQQIALVFVVYGNVGSHICILGNIFELGFSIYISFCLFLITIIPASFPDIIICGRGGNTINGDTLETSRAGSPTWARAGTR